MPDIIENILIMVLTIVFLIGGGYLFLLLLGWALKFKTGGRELEGLTNLWLEAQKEKTSAQESRDAKQEEQ